MQMLVRLCVQLRPFPLPVKAHGSSNTLVPLDSFPWKASNIAQQGIAYRQVHNTSSDMGTRLP